MMKNPVLTIEQYVRATNYLVGTQIYLKNNYLLEQPLKKSDIKPRLIGHWGSCPGINFIYAHLNYLIIKHKQSVLFILGPGHGFAAVQANLFLEGTLQQFYPEAAHTKAGIGYISKNFSWPGGFQSHCNPTTPGVILEGGELGYSLSTAYGTVLDNPDLLTVCVVGDGEAETGPLAAAWHLNKLVDPRIHGTVLPILHLNGYKISGPTVFGRMSDGELLALFKGYGYTPYIVDEHNAYERMIQVLERCYQQIQIQKRNSKQLKHPVFPMIILKTPKGWTGIKRLHGEKIEGNFLAHQVIAPNAYEDDDELHAVERWLKSYKFPSLFSEKDGFAPTIRALIPPRHLRMGLNKHAYGTLERIPLTMPDIKSHAEPVPYAGFVGSSSMRRIGLYLADVFIQNARTKNFRLFSPDETYSNKLDDIFTATARAFVWPRVSWDKDLRPNGRVMELLSEHSLLGLMQGFILTGRHGIFASYEAFVQIVSSMVDQYAKFLKVSLEIPWRGQIPSMNIILTSSGWRQEHNGFSHQNPGFISDVMNKRGCFTRVYFPPDGNSALVCLQHALKSTNRINVIVAGKTQEPRWLTVSQAEEEYHEGLMTWDFASDSNPDIVLVGIGDYMTKEMLAAMQFVRGKKLPLRMRFVNVLELSCLCANDDYCCVSVSDFDKHFTSDKPVIINFHGNPETVKPYLIDHKNPHRFVVHGYIDNGSITTPFDMQVRNKTSRYHIAMDIYFLMIKQKIGDKKILERHIQECQDILHEHGEYIIKYGVDPPHIEQWLWHKTSS